MKHVHLLVTLECEDDTHPGVFEGLDYIEFGGRGLPRGWADQGTAPGDESEGYPPLGRIVGAELTRQDLVAGLREIVERMGPVLQDAIPDDYEWLLEHISPATPDEPPRRCGED